MADDNVDWRFLGRQVQNLQVEVRDLKAGQLRHDSDVASTRSEVARLHAELTRFQADVAVKFEQIDVRFDRLEADVRELKTQLSNLEHSLDARFARAAETTAANFQILLEAIKGRGA